LMYVTLSALALVAPPAATARRSAVEMMGRKFENNKLRMAKTALAYAKKASYIGCQVVNAVKAAGDDPSTNLKLAAVMREANALNVPKEVVERNIKKAMDPVTSAYRESTYEAYGHGGVGFIINCLSDNSNRVTAEVNTVVKKTGCSIASSGSVTFNFLRKGRLLLRSQLDEERLIELAIEAGVDGDVELQPPDPDGRGDDENVACVVLTEATELGAVQSTLQRSGIECAGSLVYVPLASVSVSEDHEAENFAAIDRLEELDDVTNVEHNMAIS